jgi:putative membrane protein
MTTILSMCVMGFVLLATPAWAADVKAADVKAEIDFVTRASIGHLFAIAESQLAIDKADDSQVKAFARQLIEDHERDKAALVSAADGSGAAPATALDGDHQAHLTALQGKSGTDFDKAYVTDQEEIHSNTLTLYADYMLLGDNAKLKVLAIKMIPVTETQLKKAQTLSRD